MSLRVSGLSRSWKGYWLRDINLEIDPGEYFVLLGPTGAGKTLLLESLMGIHRIDTGKVTLNGADITDVPTEKRGIGYIPQQSHLFPHMTVRQNVEFGLKIRGASANALRSRADRVLGELGILSLADRAPASLSGGETQKVALARVMAIEPALILLDEPLSAIDTETRQTLRDYLKGKQSDSGTSFLHVTHDQVEAFSMANRIALIRDGVIVQTGSPKEIFTKPKDEFVARFLGYENIFRGKAARSANGLLEVDVSGIAIKASLGAVWTGMHTKEGAFECVLGVRTDGIAISDAPCPEPINCFKGVIEDYADLGSIIKASIRTDKGLTFHAIETTNAFIANGLDRRKTVWVSFTPEFVRILSIDKG
jgi:molybdate/tungstate transport system ATP-binding protein